MQLALYTLCVLRTLVKRRLLRKKDPPDDISIWKVTVVNVELRPRL